MITERFEKEFLAKLDNLERLEDKYWCKQLQAEAAGDTEKAAKMDHKMDCIHAEMEGMLSALGLLGYVVQYQPNPVIVRA